MTEADDGVDGLRKLAAGKFDIIMTDINMPIMDGLKLVKRVRSDPTHKDVPIIVITTEGSSEDRQRALQLGANAYITKPIQAPQVIAKVKELLKIDVVTRIKICGVTSADQARACVEAGADSMGVNFVASSVRGVSTPRRPRADRAGGGLERAGGRGRRRDDGGGDAGAARRDGRRVPAAARRRGRGRRRRPAAARVQGRARGGRPTTCERARAMPGDYVLVDAKVEGALGGTGHAFDWSLVVDLAARRRLVLAGGLTPGERDARDRDRAPLVRRRRERRRERPGRQGPGEGPRLRRRRARRAV